MKNKGGFSNQRIWLSALAGTVCLSSPVSAQEQEKEKPNFLFILVDDLGYKDLGCYGSSFYETPHVDELAAEGVKFTDAYATSPVSSPTRSSIMTGKYPARTDNTDWFGAPQPENAIGHWVGNHPMLPAPYVEHMELGEVTIAEALKEGGYRTFFAGKWHLGHKEKHWPLEQGFDINKGGWSKGRPHRQDGANGYFSPYGIPTLEDGPVGEHLPDRLAEETIEFIDQERNQPFLAYLSFYEVHTPLMTTKEMEQKYRNKKEALGLEDRWGKEGDRRVRLVQSHPVYAGMVEDMDRAVGRVMDKLESAGLDKNTIVFFVSDNGGLSTGSSHPTSIRPLRAGKGWLYEGGIREPMIIKWPGVTQGGTVCDVPVTSTDFYPTMLEMADQPLRPDQHQDGRSLVSLLKQGEAPDREALYWHYPHNGPLGSSPGSVIRQGRYKLIRFYEQDRVELYDLSVDIGEEHDISGDMPKLTRNLLQKLNRWLEETDAKYPSPNPEYEGDDA